jgi:hypothetical protein
MRCDDCKHWDKDNGKYGTGLCQKAAAFWDVSEWREYNDDDFPKPEEEAQRWKRGLKPEFTGLKMFSQDGSDYHAYLLTMPDFFCAHFEAR